MRLHIEGLVVQTPAFRYDYTMGEVQKEWEQGTERADMVLFV